MSTPELLEAAGAFLSGIVAVVFLLGGLLVGLEFLSFGAESTSNDDA